jgi:hypothetical protein
MATWRRRLVQALAVLLAGGLSAAGWLAYQLTNGPAVRQQVIAQLRKHFIGADVALGSARFRLLGGITVDNLTLYRRDDPSQTPILHVPTGVIYHDKEQLAQGRLAIRKLKLERPRLTVTRAADGRWNLAGILGRVRPDIPIPVIEVEQGTVALEFATAADAPPGHAAAAPLRLELRHVNLTVLNHPLPVLAVEARGESALLGPVHLQGSWHRVLERLDAALDLAPVPVGPALVRELARLAPSLAEPVRQVAGVGRLHLGVQYRPDPAPAWGYQVRAELAQGRLEHRDLPLPLENLELSARCDDGVVTLERLTATAGPATVALKAQFGDLMQPAAHHPAAPPAGPDAGLLRAPHPASLIPAAFDVVRSLELTVQRLPLTPELFARLPGPFRQYQQRYAPSGPCDLTCRLERVGGQWRLRARLRPDGITGRLDVFPYPLRQVRGSLDLTLTGNQPRLDVDLTCEANERRPVTIRGHADGEHPDYDFVIQAGGALIDDTLLEALPAKFRAVTRSFHPSGRCDITARLTRPAGAAVASQHYAVRLSETTVRYDVFPYPLEDLSGALDIRLGPGPLGDPRPTWVIAFDDIRAGHAGGRVFLSGSARPAAHDGNQITLRLRGERIALDATLAEALAPMRLRTVWEMLAPSGRMDFTAAVTHTDSPHGPRDYDITVAPAGATVRPSFFPLTLADASGTFRVTPGRVELGEFRASHGPTRFTTGAGLVLHSDGGYWVDLRALRAAPLPVDAELVRALPPALQAVCGALEPRGALAVDVARLVVHEPHEPPGPPTPAVIYWDGGLRFTDAALTTGVAWEGVTGQVACRGRYRGQLLEGVEGHIALDRATVFGQPLTGLHADALVLPESPHELRLCNVHGQLFGGQLGGEAHVAFGAGLQYQIDLKAMQVRLEEFGRHNRLGGNAQLSGLAKAELYLTGTGHGVNELEGGGNLHIPAGRMYNLPLVLDLLKVPALHAPDGTAFEEAHAEFKVHGRRVQVQRLDLLGNAISLGGRGELNLDGSDLNMDFYAVWGHIVQVLPPGLRELPPWLSKNLLLVRARGPVSKPELKPEPVPALVEPVKQLVERARGRSPGPGMRAQKPEDRGQRTEDRPWGTGVRAKNDGS